MDCDACIKLIFKANGLVDDNIYNYIWISLKLNTRFQHTLGMLYKEGNTPLQYV